MKRFYKTAEPLETAEGWTVALDGKPIRTPAKSRFVAPNGAVAAAAAAEWAAQEGEVRPATMPVTRAVNTAIDRTAGDREAVADIVAAYGGSDLICYRAEEPAGLRARQAEAWDPLLAWAEARFAARLIPTSGVMPIRQPAEGLARLRAAAGAYSPLGLTALHDLVALSGSLVIGLAVAEAHLSPDMGWRLSRVDEAWQEEFWGVDEEAAAAAAVKAADFAAAARLIGLLGDG